MATERIITPDYLSTDYETYKRRISAVLKKNTEFKDFDFEGSNLSILIELLAYQNELQTYYINKIAQEVYDDSCQLWENAHRIAAMKGYNARGYISSRTNVTVTIPQKVSKLQDPNFDFGDSIYVPYGTEFTAIIQDSNRQDKTLKFISTQALNLTVPEYVTGDEEIDLQYSFNVPVAQGELVNLSYTGADIVDNKIVLPFYKFNHDIFDNQDYSTMSLSVNGEYWTRVPNFYHDTTNITEDVLNTNMKVFSLMYDKFKRYVIQFGWNKAIPGNLDEIEISLIRCDGSLGNIGKDLITRIEANKIQNITKQTFLKSEYFKVTNMQSASGGADPQNIDGIILSGKGNIEAQERCVTRGDYITYLKSRQDIYAANVWGEKEVSKKGNVKEYNKVHVSVMPALIGTDTLIGREDIWETEIKTGSVFTPLAYYSGFIEDLKVFLEKRKFITTYEQFEVPDLIYFAFHIGLRISKHYNYVEVANTFMDKLNHYFATVNRNYGDKISFLDIHNWMMDTTVTTENKVWEGIKGIENCVFRKIWINAPTIPDWKRDFYALPPEGGEYIDGDGIEQSVNKGYNIIIPEGSNIYPPNDEFDVPKYTHKDFLHQVDNKTKIIQLGPNQFPVLAYDMCGISQEY